MRRLSKFFAIAARRHKQIETSHRQFAAKSRHIAESYDRTQRLRSDQATSFFDELDEREVDLSNDMWKAAAHWSSMANHVELNVEVDASHPPSPWGIQPRLPHAEK